jgi:hypothetical protein
MRNAGLAGMLLLGSVATVGCSSGSEERPPSSRTAQLIVPTAAHCDGGDREHEIESCSISVPSSNVIVLSFSNKLDDGRVSLSTTLTNDVKAHEFQWTQRFQVQGHEIFRRVFDLKADKSFQETVDYGAHFSGPKHVELSSADGKTATALVDGRATLPFSLVKADAASILRFTNGKPVPVDELHGEDLKEDARKLFQDAEQDHAACFKPKIDEAAAELVAANASTPSLVPRAAALSLTQTPSSQFPGAAFESVLCAASYTGGVAAVFFGCGLLVTAVGSACGPFALVCDVVGLVGCGIAALETGKTIEGSNLCCPRNCTNSGNTDTDLCCDSEGECMSAGFCCEHGSACGDECCAPNIKCIGRGASQTCCKPGAECGGACCDNGNGFGGTCINAATSTCCMPPSVQCFNSGCCAPTETCTPGDHGQGVCTPSTSPCSLGACVGSDVTNCPVDPVQGETVCTNGCCAFNGR